MKTIKTMFLTRTKWIPLVLVITAVALLICYNAFAQPRQGTGRARNTNGTGLPSDAQISGRAAHPDENDPEYVKMREWLRSSKVSSSDFVKAVAAARALPPSPLLQSRNFTPLGPLTTQWTFPFLSPLYNEFGHGGDPCPIPSPTPNSPCGASARIAAIAVDPLAANGDVVYVGSEGGLSKSTDGGGHWTYLSDGFASQSIRCITIDHINSKVPAIIYVGTSTTQFFGQGIYRSTDAGATFTQLGATFDVFLGKRVLKIVVDPATAGSPTSTTLYASVVKGGENGACQNPGDCTHSVWKSTNSGSTWTQIRSVGGAPADVGGWTFYDIAIDPNAPSTLYITSPYTAPPGGVFKSTDGGATWGTQPIYNLPTADPSFLTFAYISVAQTVLYLGYSSPSPTSGDQAVIARSTDQGSHWTVLNTPGPAGTYVVHELFALGVDLVDFPVEQHRIVAGVGADLNYSTDGGTTWLTAQPPNPPPAPPCNGHCAVHPDTHSIAFCKSNSLRNYVGTDGGIYRADDSNGSHGFITWWSKNENLAGALMQGVSISADGSMVMGNQDNGTQLHAAPTPNPPWVFVPYGGGDGYKPKIDQTNSNRYYYQGFSYGLPVCDGWRAVSRVCDGTCTSREITPAEACGESSQAFPALFAAPTNWQRVIVGFQNIYRSTNSGDSWTRINSSPLPGVGTVWATYEAPTNTNVIYAVMDRLRVLATTDGGATWNPPPIQPPAFINAVTVDPANASTAYLACDSGIYKTTDSGRTWTLKTTAALADLIYQDVAIDPANNQHVFVSSFGGVLSSTNGGDAWSDMSAGIPAGMAAGTLSFNATSRKLAVSTYGRGAYILDLSQ